MSNEWEREKQKILNALIGQGQDVLDFPQDTEVNLVLVQHLSVPNSKGSDKNMFGKETF